MPGGESPDWFIQQRRLGARFLLDELYQLAVHKVDGENPEQEFGHREDGIGDSHDAHQQRNGALRRI